MAPNSEAPYVVHTITDDVIRTLNPAGGIQDWLNQMHQDGFDLVGTLSIPERRPYAIFRLRQ